MINSACKAPACFISNMPHSWCVIRFGSVMDLAGKVVLITGASEGIGAACAAEFRKRGAHLSITARSEEKMRSASPGDTVITPGDITDPEVRLRIVENTIERFGKIDVLVNNAGKGLYTPAWRAPMKEVRDLFELNFFVPLAMVQLVAPHMRDRHSGTIVNVSSIAGKVTLPWLTVYCTSKYALGSLTEGLRMELGQYGIHTMLAVNSLNRGALLKPAM